MFVADDDAASGVLKVFHAFSSYPGVPGAVDPDRFRTFAFEGDVTGVDILSVAIDDTMFDRTGNVNIASTPERHFEVLNQDDADELVGPFADDEPNTRTAHSRYSMYILYQFVSLVIGKDLNAREAFRVLWPAILDAGMTRECAELTRFLMVAGTEPTNAAVPVTVRV